jgi:hypothetical protein
MTDRTTMNTSLMPCPLCQAAALLRAGYSGKAGYHWPSIMCENGHGFRLYRERMTLDTAKAELITAWNTRIESQSSPTADDGLVSELRAIDARLRAVPTQEECAHAINDLLAFMDKHAPLILAALSRVADDRAAVEAERERSALIAENYVIDGFATRSFWNAWRKARAELAAAIRAPSTPSPTRTQDDE